MPSILLPVNTLQSIDKLDRFCSENKAFFRKNGKQFEVFETKGNYFELVSREEVLSSFQYINRKTVTHQFLEKCVHLLQASPVKHAVENPQKHGTHLPTYLFWLASNSSSFSASDTSDNTFAGASSLSSSDFSSRAHSAECSNKQEDLYLKHLPSTTSLLHTVSLAAGHKQEKLPMQARLVLNIPSNFFINSAQLMYVLNAYVPAVRHYFKTLSTHFDRKQDATNYINCPSLDSEGELELVVRHVSEDHPYSIVLNDMYFDEQLFTNDIDHLMKPLEGHAPLVLENGVVRFLKESKYPDIPYEQLSPLEHKFTLRVVGNLYPPNENYPDRQLGQYKKIVHCNESKTAFIPSVETLFEDKDSSVCKTLQLFHQSPTSLHALSQKDYANWFLEAPVKDLNTAYLSLLSRMQSQQPFTLPASAEVIGQLHCITGYLLKHSSVTEEQLLTLVNQETFDALKEGRKVFNSVELILDPDRREKIDRLRQHLKALHSCCEELPHAEKLNNVRDRLYATFGFTFEAGHDIAYCPFVTACIIAKSLNILAQIYDLLGVIKLLSNSSSDYCNSLMCKGILPQFISSSLWSVAHSIKATCLPMGFAITSFDVETSFFSSKLNSSTLLFRSYLQIVFAANTIVDESWKLECNHDHQVLMHNIWQVRTELSKMVMPFAFVDKAINPRELLLFFDLVLYFLINQLSFRKTDTQGTQTRVRMLPSAFPHSFFEKIRHCFYPVKLLFPFELKLCYVSDYILQTMGRVQYSTHQAAIMVCAANILFRTILEQTHSAMPKGEVSVEYLLGIFKNQLAASERLLYLCEQNWLKLVDAGILYQYCEHIFDTESRLMLLATPSYQERIRLAVVTWSLERGKVFLSDRNFNSIDRVLSFFFAHRDFFLKGERYFDVYMCADGYELVVREQIKASDSSDAYKVAQADFPQSAQVGLSQPAQADLSQAAQVDLSQPAQVDLLQSAQVDLLQSAQGCSKYDKRKNVTYWFVSRLVSLLQDSLVKDAVENHQKIGSFLFHYLYWLDVTDSVDSNPSEPSLCISHLPSCSSLMHTFLLARHRGQANLPMYGRLILEVPKGKVNREQLDYVLNKFVETAYQHFKTLSSSFEEDIKSNNFLFSPVNYDTSKLELVFQRVAENKPYIISLWNVYFDELLFISNIDQPMQLLEESSTPIMYAQESILLPQFRYSALSLEVSDEISCDTLPFGLVALPRHKLADCSVYKSVLPCKQITHDQLRVTLAFIGNTYPDQQIFFASEAMKQQAQKMVLSQKNLMRFIPPIERQFVNCTTSLITSYFHHQPDRLHAISQSDFADWLLNTPIKELHFAVQSLLSKVQDGKAFTLPASAQVVSIMQGFMEYLLGIGDVDDAFVAKYLNDSSSLPLLQKARVAMVNVDSFDDSVRQMQNDLRALHACSKALSFKEQCADASFSLEQAFNVQFEQQTYNIAYPPQQIAFLIAKFLELLTKVYDFSSGADIEDDSMHQYYSALVCKGSLPFFMLQFEVDIPHLNKVTCLPVEVVGVTFDKNNHHDGLNYTPARFWGHDYFFHPYYINTFIDALWKWQQNYERVVLMHNIEQVRAQLANNADSFTFVHESIGPKQLLQTFDLLIFLLMHETYGVINTHTRARITPFSFPHTFLEKVRAYFSGIDLKSPNKLNLRNLFEDFTDDMKALLPLQSNSSFLYFATCLLVDTVVEETRNAMPEREEVLALDIITAFKQKLLKQEDLLYLYEDNWENLISVGILYENCADITNIDERLRVLAQPHVQERLRNEIIHWPLDLQAAKQKHERRFARKARMKDCVVM